MPWRLWSSTTGRVKRPLALNELCGIHTLIAERPPHARLVWRISATSRVVASASNSMDACLTSERVMVAGPHLTEDGADCRPWLRLPEPSTLLLAVTNQLCEFTL